MKSLETIQKVAKFGKILSKIVFIFCFIGLIFTLIGAISVSMLDINSIINDESFTFIEAREKSISKGAIYDDLIIGSIALICEMYIAKKALNYFKFELEEGTPFTEESANKIKKLGITVIIAPIIATIISAIGHVIITKLMGNVGDVDINYDISLAMGLVFLFLSAVFRYGASLEKKETKKTSKAKKDKEPAK